MLVKTLSEESSRISVGACACESAVITGNIIIGEQVSIAPMPASVLMSQALWYNRERLRYPG